MLQIKLNTKRIVSALVITGVAIMLSYTYSFAANFTGLYIGLQLGESIAGYTNNTLSDGAVAESIKNSGFSERVYLGFNFSQYLAAEFSVNYFTKPSFKNLRLGGDDSDDSEDPDDSVTKTIKNNIISLVARFNLPLTERIAANAKVGIGYVARNGIVVNNLSVLPQSEIFAPVYGLGVSYRLALRWDLEATWMQAASNSEWQLPVSNFFGFGVTYKFGL